MLPQKILAQIKIVKNLVASKYTGELGKENDDLNALHAQIKVQMTNQKALKETPILCRFRAKISETQTQGLIFFLMYLFLTVLGFVAAWAFLFTGNGGCSLDAVPRFLIVVASLSAEHRL